MEGPFGAFFDRAAQFMAAQQFQAQQQQEEHRRPPPASVKAVRQLPTVIVSPEDLVDPSNRECCICLEQNHLRERVTRLPCAHIFHQACIRDWLTRSCTCPVCRYELATDDAAYERTRQERMRHRKPRFAMYELQRMSTQELHELGDKLRVRRMRGDQGAMIATLVKSNRIDIIAAPEPVEYPLSLLRAMGIKELKQCMADAGVFFDPIDVVEKEDMVRIFINSGRLVILPEPKEAAKRESPNQDFMDKKVAGKRSCRQVPIVTTVVDSSDDEDDNMAQHAYQYKSDNAGGSPRPFMEEVIPPHVPSVSRNDSSNIDTTVNDASSSHSLEERPIDTAQSNQSSSVDNASVQDVEIADVEMEEATVDENETPPRVMGRHSSANSAGLVNDYSSSATAAAEDPRFQERSIAELRTLARSLHVNVDDCIERSEIIQKLLNADDQEPPQLQEIDLGDWSVSELRALAAAVNVDLSHCTDRHDMIDALMQAADTRPRVSEYLRALSPLARLTVPQLRAVAREWRVNVYDCLEKEEMITRLVSAGGPTS